MAGDGEAFETEAAALAETAGDAWGQIYVTRRCCGGGTCRNYAPELFGEVAPPADRRGALPVLPGSHEEGAFTGVLRQPASEADWKAARTAAAGCGFGAIRIRKPAKAVAGGPWNEWPRRVEEGENVWALGQPSTRNYGALSYFIEREGGGVLVDLPKPSEGVFQWLEAHGGVKHIFLSHKDHVQHHAEYAARFPGAQRIMGRGDVNKRQNPYEDATVDVEIKIDPAQGPSTIAGVPVPPADRATAELLVLPQPGHTPGGVCLLYRGRFLFTGDHLCWSRRLGHVVAHRLQCWEDWERQTRSVAQLQAWAAEGWLRFAWVLPGHGEWRRPDGEATAASAAAELARTVAWMQAQPAGNVPLLRWIPFVMSRKNPNGRFARVVRTIGGRGREAWLIPAAARTYLTDASAIVGGRTASARLTALALGAVVLAGSAAGLLAYAIH